MQLMRIALIRIFVQHTDKKSLSFRNFVLLSESGLEADTECQSCKAGAAGERG